MQFRPFKELRINKTMSLHPYNFNKFKETSIKTVESGITLSTKFAVGPICMQCLGNMSTGCEKKFCMVIINAPLFRQCPFFISADSAFVAPPLEQT